MFTFISFWRTAAMVLCDLASTAYYIGGIVESQIGEAAPWFILAVMLFSYARAEHLHRELRDVRARRRLSHGQGGHGGWVGQAGGLGPLFDYILTGPISGVPPASISSAF